MEKKQWVTMAACGALVLASFSTAARSQSFALHDGDTVVFYGDSITAQHLYTRFVEEFVLTRYPAMNVRFINAGVPGDTVRGGYAGTMMERVQRDVTPFHPGMITVMLGMNDGGWAPGTAKPDEPFQEGYRALLDALHKAAPGSVFTLISSTPYDEITHGSEFPGYAHVIDDMAEDVARIASRMQASGDKDILFSDFHRPVTEALDHAEQQFPQLAPLIIPDRIHPAPAGHWIMTAALMSAWHVDPVVSRLSLNAGSLKVVEKDRTLVTSLEKSGGELKWTQLDEALPLPLDLNNAMTPMLLKVSEISALDQEFLKVESLESGMYELLIDAKPVAAFSSEELEHGVNLALYKTPMLEQARGIDWTEERRAMLDQARFLISADVKGNSTTAITESSLFQAEQELAMDDRVNLTPKPHQFELRRR